MGQAFAPRTKKCQLRTQTGLARTPFRLRRTEKDLRRTAFRPWRIKNCGGRVPIDQQFGSRHLETASR
jgi:hypothetical protein